jgi:hypothetical protein
MTEEMSIRWHKLTKEKLEVFTPMSAALTIAEEYDSDGDMSPTLIR